MFSTAGFLRGGSCVAASAPDGPKISASNASLRFIAPHPRSNVVILTNAATALVGTSLIVPLSLDLVNPLTQWVEIRPFNFGTKRPGASKQLSEIGNRC